MDSRKSPKNSKTSKPTIHNHNSKPTKNISSRKKTNTFSLKLLDYDTF